MKYLSVALLMLSAAPASAYIGPGLGAGVAATVLGVLGALALAVAAIVYYPLKRIINARKARRAKADETTAGHRRDGTRGPSV